MYITKQYLYQAVAAANCTMSLTYTLTLTKDIRRSQNDFLQQEASKIRTESVCMK